ncbi:MAG TPA: ATP-dependent Clp protease adaptor ClpS [Gaiellaceae bacterium]|nr:ATP-dependent Clp protease adaptor ClpS [Gaiellaceae bacterium]
MPPATRTPSKERLDRGLGSGLGEPWNVVVLNDDHNTFAGVAFALSAVLPGVSYDAGMRFANTIHFAGSAIVWTGHQELAELFWSRLGGFGLTMAPLGG